MSLEKQKYYICNSNTPRVKYNAKRYRRKKEEEKQAYPEKRNNYALNNIERE